MLWRTSLGLGGSSSEPSSCDLADGLLVVGTTGHVQQLPQVLVAEDPLRVFPLSPRFFLAASSNLDALFLSSTTRSPHRSVEEDEVVAALVQLDVQEILQVAVVVLVKELKEADDQHLGRQFGRFV